MRTGGMLIMLALLSGCSAVRDRMDDSGGLPIMRTPGGGSPRLADSNIDKVELLVVDVPRRDDPERRVLALAIRNSGDGIARVVPRLTVFSTNPKPGECETFDADWDWAIALKPGHSTVVPLSYYEHDARSNAASPPSLQPVPIADTTDRSNGAGMARQAQYVGLLVVLAEPQSGACQARMVWSRNPIDRPQRSDAWSYSEGELASK